MACGIFPDQGSNWCPLHYKGELLTTGPPRKPNTLDFNRWFIHAKLWEEWMLKKKKNLRNCFWRHIIKISLLFLRSRKPKPSLGLKNHVPHTENVQGILKRNQRSNFKHLRALGLNSRASFFQTLTASNIRHTMYLQKVMSYTMYNLHSNKLSIYKLKVNILCLTVI